MNKYFDQAFEYVLGDEGKVFTNDPDDDGGPTKFGVTQKTYEAFLKRPVTIEEMQNMAQEEAEEIYLQDYWLPMNCISVKHLGVAIALFNCSVLYGVRTAGKLAQRASNICGASLKVDGYLGDNSLATINSIRPVDFLSALYAAILERIDKIIEADPTDEKYRRGWTNRAKKLIKLKDIT